MVTHNDAAADFTVPFTSDLNLVGEYFFTIRSAIRFPADSSLTTYIDLFDEYQVSVQINPCEITDYTTVPIPKLTYIIGDPAALSDEYVFT